MIDVLDYKQVIKDVLSQLGIKRDQREDMTQECYVALLEKAQHLERSVSGGHDKKYATAICRHKIHALWGRGQHPYRSKEKPGPRIDSLSDPKILHLVEKSVFKEEGVTEEQLQDAILSLAYEDYSVIYSVYVEGKTEVKTGEDLGLTRRQVQFRKERGVEALKKYFEENI